jgi:phage terminase large subunit-like protein
VPRKPAAKPAPLDPGARAVAFINNLTHTGDFAGKPFALRPWQSSIVEALFGTLRPDGLRRYRKAFLALPRKQGKTELAAGVLLYLLLGTGKTDQRIYSASGDRAQASLIYHAASRMVRQDPTLDRLCLTYDGYKRIVHEPSGNVYEALSSEAYSKHGLGPSAVLFDEVHVLRDREFHDVLTTGYGARVEPLTWYITTAGWDRLSLCYELWQHAEAVRDGLRNDPTFLPILYAAGKADDWRDEASWFRAMPALGDFCSLEFIRDEYARACSQPSFENTFRQLYLNQWTEQAERWISIEKWTACGVRPLDETSFAGRECHAGLDLATSGDMAAFVRLFTDPDGSVSALCRFYAPERGRWRDEPQNRELYPVWASQGFLTLTPGEEIDFDFIERDIVEVDETTPITLLLADRAFATQVCTRLMNLHGMGERVQFLPQTPIRLNEPTLELERLVNAGKFRHGGHPVLSWNAQNAATRKHATGLIQLDKARSTGRIDGLAGAVNALAGILNVQETMGGGSPLVLL